MILTRVDANSRPLSQRFVGIASVYQFLKKIPINSYSLTDLCWFPEFGNSKTDRMIRVNIAGISKENVHQVEAPFEYIFILGINDIEQRAGILRLEMKFYGNK